MSLLTRYYMSLLHFNDPNTSTTFRDESGKTWTPAGNAQIVTAQSKFGGSSLGLDGTGDWLLGDGSSDFAFGTGNWLIDFWFRQATQAAAFLFGFGTDSTTAGRLSLRVSGSPFNLIVRSGVALDIITGTTAILGATWYHVTVTHGGSNTNLYLNGGDEGGVVDSVNYGVSASRPVFGSGNALATPLNGNIDELRILKGLPSASIDVAPPVREYRQKKGARIMA